MVLGLVLSGCGVDDGKRDLRALGRVLRFVPLQLEDAKRREGLGGTYEGVGDDGGDKHGDGRGKLM